MTDESPPAPGWWQASDGHWYAPEAHPGYRPPSPPPGSIQARQAGDRWVLVLAVVVVVIVALIRATG